MPSFYALQLVSVVVWWLLVYRTTGKHLFSLCTGSVITRPSWLPPPWLLALAEYRRPIVTALPGALALGAIAGDEHVGVRVLVALAVSLYHLLETAHTSRHGEFPVLYCAWAMVLPQPWAGAAAWGVVVHFVLSCGVAKCFVGGVAAWCTQPATMRAYLDAYRGSHSAPPLSRAFSAWLGAHAASLAGGGTIALEVLAVPATLLLSPASRVLVGVWGMLALHVGIGFALSARVALVFFTTLPTYAVGFACDAPLASPPWALAAAVALLPSACSLLLFRRLLPEDWPCTPCSLFMWNGPQASRLARLAMTGDTRLVMCTREVCEGAQGGGGSLVGLPIMHHGGSGAFGMGAAASGPVMHDSIMRVLGFTLVHAGLTDALDDSVEEEPTEEEPRAVASRTRAASRTAASGELGSSERRVVKRLLQRLEEWLSRERRLLESATGRPLARAFFVRLDGEQKVAEVLLEA